MTFFWLEGVGVCQITLLLESNGNLASIGDVNWPKGILPHVVREYPTRNFTHPLLNSLTTGNFSVAKNSHFLSKILSERPCRYLGNERQLPNHWFNFGIRWRKLFLSTSPKIGHIPNFGQDCSKIGRTWQSRTIVFEVDLGTFICYLSLCLHPCWCIAYLCYHLWTCFDTF